jgi:hypothetical protein
VIINTKKSLLLVLRLQFSSRQPAYFLLPISPYSQLNTFRNSCRIFTFIFFLFSVYFEVQTRSAGPVESVLYVDEAVSLLLPEEKYWH